MPLQAPADTATTATLLERWNGSTWPTFKLPPRHGHNGHTANFRTTPRQRKHLTRHDTPTFRANHGHNCRGPHCRQQRQKKSPTRHFIRWGLLSYSVTIFTISSAVFPSRAFRNFAFASPRFTSGMCFSASWSILASPGVNLFNRSKIAKQ